MQEDNGKYIFGVVKVGDRGQIVIPKDAREIYGIKAGDSLLVLGDSKQNRRDRCGHVCLISF